MSRLDHCPHGREICETCHPDTETALGACELCDNPAVVQVGEYGMCAMHRSMRPVGPKPDTALVSPTPRWDIAGHPDVAVHMALADLTVQVARIANALEYQAGMKPDGFPCTDNERLGLHGRDGRPS